MKRDSRIFKFDSGVDIIVARINFIGARGTKVIVEYSKHGSSFCSAEASPEKWRDAFRRVRHLVEMKRNPHYRKIHNRLQPPNGYELLDQVLALRTKLQVSVPATKHLYVNFKTAAEIKRQLGENSTVYGRMPKLVILDELSDNQILAELEGIENE